MTKLKINFFSFHHFPGLNGEMKNLLKLQERWNLFQHREILSSHFFYCLLIGQ